jgi:hypothetical protein
VDLETEPMRDRDDSAVTISVPSYSGGTCSATATGR